MMSPWQALAKVADTVASDSTRVRWPSARWRDDPVAFFRDVLGLEPWSRQIELCEAIRDHDRVAVKSGHKVSKSNTGAGIALWWYASQPDARVVATCVTDRQINEILYREIKILHERSGYCVECSKANAKRRESNLEALPRPCPHSAVLDGAPKQLARSGISSVDHRQIRGFTAKEKEAVAGVSGARILYIVDEASGVPDDVFEAIQGNMAAGAKLLLFSNPTRKEGHFFEAFGKRSKFYKTMTVSSMETPNYVEGRVVIPGLAGRPWVEQMREEYGEDSAFFRMRVLGEFPTDEEGKIISLHRITEACERWSSTPATGPLQIGIDVAGPGDAGDESVFFLRRGLRHLASYPFRGLTEEAHLVHLLSMLKVHSPNETATVVIDREGPIGYKVWSVMRAHAASRTDYHLVGIRSSDAATREPHLYDRLRDELWASTARWLKDGGAIIDDSKLNQELHSASWHGQINGKLKATDKRTLKKALGRSPDRADAMQLATWEVRGLEEVPDARPTETHTSSLGTETETAGDPYDALSVWGRS